MVDTLLKKKKECVQMLLKEDIELYNQFLEKIKDMNDDIFINLFNGNFKFFEKEENYHFKLLVYKFQNFTPFLIAWYNKSDKIKYLKELWINYICIEDLRNLYSKEKIEKFMNERTNYKDWPEEIKDEFHKLINGNINKEDKNIKDVFENLTKYEKDLYIQLEILIRKYGSEYKGIKKIGEKYQYELLKNYISPISKILFEQFKNKILSPSENQDSNISNIIFDLKNSISNNPKIKSTVINITEGVLGLANLLFAINEFLIINKEVEQIEEFKVKLDKIKEDFDENAKLLKDDILSKYDLVMIKTKIDEGIQKIEKNLIEINQLIIEIETEIEKCNNKKNMSLGLIVISGILTGLSFGNYLATRNISSLINSATNAGNYVINSKNSYKYISLIKDLKNLLEEVKKERDAMLNSEHEIKKIMKKIINGKPNYY